MINLEKTRVYFVSNVLLDMLPDGSTVSIADNFIHRYTNREKAIEIYEQMRPKNCTHNRDDIKPGDMFYHRKLEIWNAEKAAFETIKECYLIYSSDKK